MTREEEIIQAARSAEKETVFTPIVSRAKGVNSAYGIGFLEGAEWADKTIIDKACEWLKSQYKESYHEALVEDLIKRFRKALEE